jgi:selenocysteine-specific elongation factor
VRDEVAETTLGSFLENAEVVSVSSKTGEGVEKLKKAIHDLALAIQPRPSDRLLRLPIDRSFSIRGFGTVVTGTLTSGEILKDQEVELIPGGLIARVRGLQVHGNMTGRAVAGQRTAVNLQGVDLAQVERGMVITVPHLFRSTQILDVHLQLLPTAKPLKNLVKVRFHQGTLEVLARVALIGQDTLLPGKSGYATGWMRLFWSARRRLHHPAVLRRLSRSAAGPFFIPIRPNTKHRQASAQRPA